MLMVIFGAGASYDSVPSRPPTLFNVTSRPPLANQLFADRPFFAEILERFPACHPIVPYLRHLQPEQSLEGVLEELHTAAGTYAPGQRQLAAVRYYLQCMLGECEVRWEREAAQGITNYKTLLDQIERFRKPEEAVCLVTFNYDTMLERALDAVGIHVRSLADYVSSDTYKVIKLHGSLNWGRVITVPGMEERNLMGRDDWSLANMWIEVTTELRVTDQYRFTYSRPIVRDDAIPLIPALAIPLQQKQSYECPPEHLDALRKALPSVRRLLVIGWRATDRPFVELLRRDGRQALDCLVVAGGPEQAQEVAANMRHGGVDAHFRQSWTGGFTDLVLQHGADALLRS